MVPEMRSSINKAPNRKSNPVDPNDFLSDEELDAVKTERED